MSSTWTFAELVDLLKAQIEVLPAITALDPVPDIRVSMPHADEDISDVIVFGIDAADQDNIKSALGGLAHDEEVTVGCQAAVIRYGSGDVEAKAARDRVLDFLTIVDDHLRETAIVIGSATLRTPRVEDRIFESFPSLVGQDVPVRVARIAFEISYRARTTPA